MTDADLEKIISQSGDVPTLPKIASKVLQMINSDNVSLDELQLTIENDQAFASRVLKIANSSFYGRNRSIDSISDAILLIGFKTMSSLVIAAAMRDIHRHFGLFEQKLWDHSLAVSLAASMLAHETRLVSADEAHVAGLIHDVGKSILYNNVVDNYLIIVEHVYTDKSAFYEVENALLGYNHCNVGGFIARKWKLPKNLEIVIEFHHTPDSSYGFDPSYEPVCHIVAVADIMANSLGMGFSVASSSVTNRFFEVIGLHQKRYDELLESFREAFYQRKQHVES